MSMACAALAPEVAPGRWDDLAGFIEGELAAGTVPGAALIASRNGKVAFERCWGTYCGVRSRAEPLTKAVRHPFFSYSKLVSATVVVMAHQDGLVDYDEPVSKYIPQFTGGGKDAITIRHLLTHSAGIPNAPLGAVRTEEEWRAGVKSVCAAPTEWEPGSKTAYHGLSGLFVAAEAVRRVSGGKSWERICRERLFDPIGARTATFVPPRAGTPVAMTAQPKDLPRSIGEGLGMMGHPAGGCIGTPADALKVLQLHLNGGVWRGTRLLRQDELDEMHSVQYLDEIASARAKGKPPVHEPWGLGPLMRGEGPSMGGHDWFGFRDQASPGIFGHAGIDTVIGVADPATGIALFFVTADSPKPPEKTVPLRNGVTNRVFAALR